MMYILEIVKYLAVISLLVYSLFRIKDELHIMQLNSYFNSRYYNWLKGNYKHRFNILNLTIIFVTLIFCWDSFFFTNILLIIVSTIGCYKIASRKDKKKLDFTPRAIRLLIVEIILMLIPATIILWATQNILHFALVIITYVVLSFANIIISNLIVLPFELFINRWYINDARNKIQQYPSLLKIGVTGSYGKTSVKHFLNRILSEKYNVLITPGSYNTTLGVVKTIREYLQPRHEIFIIEMGAKKIGDIKEICEITNPQFGILTAVGPQHLETFGSLENVMQGKMEIIYSLPSTGIGFINSSIVKKQSIIGELKAKIITFGVDSDADYKAENIIYKGIGMTFDVLKSGEKMIKVETRLLGEHNISNLLVCCAVALEMKIEKHQIEKAIKGIEAVNHRLEVKTMDNGITIIDDAFNSNPVGSKMALEALNRFEGKRKFIITPGMIELGEQEYDLNFEFGKLIALNCDFAFLVGTNRTIPIQEGIKSTSFPLTNLFVCKNLYEANEKVKKIIQKGDVILYENDLPDTFNE